MMSGQPGAQLSGYQGQITVSEKLSDKAKVGHCYQGSQGCHLSGKTASWATFFVTVTTATIIVLGNGRPGLWNKDKDNGK